jgi:molybdenum cofactor cytidylyltransferase
MSEVGVVLSAGRSSRFGSPKQLLPFGDTTLLGQAAVCSYRGSLGHPFVFSPTAFGDLRGLHGDKAVWKPIEAYPDRVREIELDAESPPDVDTPEDHERALVYRREAS